jgi:hypothetical protein
VHLESIIGICLLPFVIFILVVYIVFRLQRGRQTHPRKKRFGFYPSSIALGNALLMLQTLTQPSVGHVIEQQMDEKSEDDDSGDPNDPLEHLHRQAERIRRGDPADRLTTWLRR